MFFSRLCHLVVVLAVPVSGFLCSVYEVCQCTAPQGIESGTTCVPGTCRYVKNYFFCGSNPTCDNNIKSWEDCEWANFRQPGDLPGQNLYMDIPFARAVDAANGFQVLSDLDDTIVCSGGGVAGVDDVCEGTETHGLYPGVAEFNLALARGLNMVEPLNVLPLSARPDWLNEVSTALNGCEREDAPIVAKFRSVGEQADVQGWTLDFCNGMYGETKDFIDVGPSPTDLTDYERMGRRKYLNWMARRAQFSKPAVFIGDNGQGDLIAAQMMIKTSSATEEPGSVHFAFIHDVKRACTDDECRQNWAGRGIYFFSNYSEAGEIAQEVFLLSNSSQDSTTPETDSASTKPDTDSASGLRVFLFLPVFGSVLIRCISR